MITYAEKPKESRSKTKPLELINEFINKVAVNMVNIQKINQFYFYTLAMINLNLKFTKNDNNLQTK